ncbi:MAG: septal ring lytic transglycosylase RlpA family protein [Legionella sp.]|uniref:septal ring lytic transglycosylase RlpA family protein n=1 Tax=Legionella sp. TaxID=459 RepID=UPI0039E48AA6
MRKILIAVAIFLAGCHSTNQSLHSGNVRGQVRAKGIQQNHNQAIYNRYKNKDNRYTQAQDGAPTNQKQLSFKEPVPKKEPISRYGNPTEYYVDGKTYKVLANSHRYKARGIASWYGTKFHKQRTSSGEPYNMYVMSAAHKTLPLPTYVRVKNLNNGKVAIVKVNDRGPFHSNRIIDLSYAAALKLGVFPKGTAHVEIEALAGPLVQGRYFIQTGAFFSEVLAKQLKAKIARFSRAPIMVERYQQRYIVKVGPLDNKSAADALKRKLAQNGVKDSFSVLI